MLLVKVNRPVEVNSPLMVAAQRMVPEWSIKAWSDAGKVVMSKSESLQWTPICHIVEQIGSELVTARVVAVNPDGLVGTVGVGS